MERHSLSPVIVMVLKCGAIYLSMLVMLLLATNVANSHAQFVGMGRVFTLLTALSDVSDCPVALDILVPIMVRV